MPRVSVVIPTYNRATVLPRALDSALTQTFTDLEVVVVVDGSTDGTTELLRTVDDPRLRWIEQPNAGLPSARNTGIDAATGEWLAFLDDDNEWHPTYLEAQLATAARTGASVVYAQGIESDDPEARPRPRATPDGDVAATMTRHGWPFITAVMVRRALANAVGRFEPTLRSHEDIDFLVRLALEVPFAATPRPLMTRHRPDGMRRSDNFEARLGASVALDRRVGPRIRARLGPMAYARWYRWWRGEAEILWVYDRPTRDRRRAAWVAARRLAEDLPWSATSLWRPLLLAVTGPTAYRRGQALYDEIHHVVTRRR